MKKLILVLLICLMAFVCFAQEPIIEKNEIPIVLMLTDGELKAILHYNETIEGFVQQVIKDRARNYMKELVKIHRKENVEAIVNALKLEPEKPKKLKKWSGLTGFTNWYSYIDSDADIWLANGFTEGRCGRDYLDTENVAASKAAVISATTKGIKCIWGVSSNPTEITATSWVDFRLAILDAAQWAQDNGVYEFCIGNEETIHVDGTTMTIVQIVTNFKALATEVQAIFTNGNVSYSCDWWKGIPAWISAGKGDIDLLSFNCYMTYGEAVSIPWKDCIDDIIDAFGTDGTYISEFNLCTAGLPNYSEDEAVQAAAITEMIDYFKSSGIQRALFYNWHDDPNWFFGAIKNDGTYRLLWNSLLNSE